MHTTSTFREIAELWKENRRSIVKHSTYCAYALILKTHLMPVFANAVSISETEVQQFAFNKLEIGLSKKTVHDIIAVLKSIVRFGAKRGMFEMPSWDIEYPSDTAARPLPVLSFSDHKKLLNAISSKPTPQNIGILIALCCGLRIGEVCALQWKDVDMVRRIITVAGTTGRIYNCDLMTTEQYVSTPKTQTSNREIPISPILFKALNVVKKQQEIEKYVVGDGHKAKEPRTYRETFSRFLKRLGIQPIVFHGLRHTFATRCIESGCDYKTVSVILGHSNVATTLNLYVHPNLDQKKRCISRMNRFLKLESD
ncbi:MAG: site-specific integrase [Muribaculaceae bacterium]|nr:site-specific integrase [Muribaculaceae bacterium]